MSIININVFTFADITAALNNAQDGDEFIFFIMNEIIFSGAVQLNRSISLNLFNGSNSETVSLSISSGGTFRHFMTVAVSGGLSNLAMTVNTGIILNGGGTGGGIFISGSACSLTLNGCTITKCRNSGNGGGVLLQGNLSRSSLVINEALIEDCQAGSGGGVFVSAGDVIMNGGAISGNRANNSGGGITTVAGANRLGSTLTISGGRISGNATVVAFGDSGGINAFDTVVTIEKSEISNNSADNNGGGILVMPQSLTPSQNALIIRDSVIRGNSIRNIGGGICVLGELGEFSLTNCLITENEATSVAVAGTNQGGGIYFVGGALTLSDSRVVNNRAGRGGGGILVNEANLVITGVAEVSGNESGIVGGGIYGFSNSTVIISGEARVTHNRALSGGDPENTSGGGGGVALFGSELTVKERAVISGNTSLSYGGGIWTFPQFTPASSVTIENVNLTENSANYGGGISMGEIPGFTPTLTIIDATISHNTALKDGGGIIAKGSLVSVIGSGITDNIAGRDGGGIFTDLLANVTVDAASFFSGNIAHTYVYWAVTSGGDSDIHRTHIFTNRFSTFIPEQTPPPEVWVFLNAYNNYDINYIKPLKTVTVDFVDTHNQANILHRTILNSFLGATVIIPARSFFVDSQGTVWELPMQQEIVLQLTDPNVDYVVTFTYVTFVKVTERYIDICFRKLATSTRTIVELGGNYRRIAPLIPGFTFIGFRINNGPLQHQREVVIIGVGADTTVFFIYRSNFVPPLVCPPLRLRRGRHRR